MKISYILDTQIGTDGKQVLNIRFAANNTRALITTPYRLYAEDWDEKKKLIRRSCKYYTADRENARLANYLNEAIQFAIALPNYERLKANEIKAIFLNRNKTDSSDFYGLIEEYAEQKKKDNPNSTSYDDFLTKMRVMQKFRNELATTDITPAFLKELENYLRSERHLKVNSIADYMINIRSVYNYAIMKGLATRDSYPFTIYKIKRERTRHRVVTIDDMRRVFTYAPESSSEAFALDMFKLSFYLIGINFKDMLNLQWKDIYNDRLVYKRMKTGRDITVKIEPEAYEIINRHKGEKRILNILEEKEKTAKPDRKSQLHIDITKTCNKHLKKIFEKLEINIPISTYYARHTWATTARKLGIDYDIIHLALGHSNGDVTAVYIEYDNEEIDEANRQVIDCVTK